MEEVLERLKFHLWSFSFLLYFLHEQENKMKYKKKKRKIGMKKMFIPSNVVGFILNTLCYLLNK